MSKTATNAASAGNYSKAECAGDSSKAASAGDSSNAECAGENCIAMVAGFSGRAKAGKGGMFALPWKSDDGKRKGIAVGIVGQDGIEADVWYAANNKGKLVRA